MTGSTFGNGQRYLSNLHGNYRLQYDVDGPRTKLQQYDLAGNLQQ